MAKISVPFLLSWDSIAARTDLDRFFLVRDNLPDEQIIRYLEVMRKNGRNDYPILPMWNALIAGIVFQHQSIEHLIRELSRNPSLLEACGFNPVPVQKKPKATLDYNEGEQRTKIVWLKPGDPVYKVPDSWNFSRFLKNVIELEECLGMISNLSVLLRGQLMEELPEFGLHLGYDGKAIQSHSTGQINQDTQQTSDPDADWGKHETRGINSKTGKQWNKIKSWFGYNLHLIADVKYEIPVAFEITPASHSEQTTLKKLIHATFGQDPKLADRCRDFVADRGLDSAGIKKMLLDEYNIRPVIDTRQLWRIERNKPDFDPSKPIIRPLFPGRNDTIFFTEKGNVHCVCPATKTLRPLIFQGFEADRKTQKFRCPAAANDVECSGQKLCHTAGGVHPGPFGRIVRVPIDKDRRIFMPTPHGTKSWEQAYNRRSSLERINNRIDNSFGFEVHFIRSKAKMKTRVGLALAVMMAMALGHVREQREDQMRSLVKPIPIVA